MGGLETLLYLLFCTFDKYHRALQNIFSRAINYNDINYNKYTYTLRLRLVSFINKIS